MVVFDVTSLAPSPARVGRWLLMLLASALYGLGWLAGRVVVLVPAVALWCAAAVALGWSAGRAPVRS